MKPTILSGKHAGKSSIVNMLARRDVAIVSPLAGTTRDVVEAHLDLAGVPVTVADTAGLRQGGDAVEAEGVRRAEARAATADLVVAVFDATTVPAFDPATLSLLSPGALVVLNKADLVDAPLPARLGQWAALATSCVTGAGIAALVEAIAAAVGPVGGEGPPLTRARHRETLAACRADLERFAAATAIELAAEDLRRAVRQLGRIVGQVDVEDILDVIFAEFCIGK